MRVGFTGTREGMSARQAEQLALVLGWIYSRDLQMIEATVFHFGGADGADMEAACIALDADILPRQIVVHPCPGVTLDKCLTTVGQAASRFAWREVFTPLRRDRNIVAESEILIAAPLTDREIIRSGTWATVRYARKAGLPIVMLSRGKVEQ